MRQTSEGPPQNDRPAHCRFLWGLLPCSRVPLWCSDGVPAPPRTTTTPPFQDRDPHASPRPLQTELLLPLTCTWHIRSSKNSDFLVWFHLWDLFECPDMKSHKKIWGWDVVCFISIFFVVRCFLLCDHVTLWSLDSFDYSRNQRLLRFW